jgi:hypothetical protein
LKTFSQELIDEKAKNSVITFWFVKIGGYYFTNCIQNFDYNGFTYLSYPIEVSSISVSDAGTLDGCNITIGSVDLTIGSLILNNDFKYADVTIEELWFDSNMNLIGADAVFKGKVDGRPSLSEQWATIAVAAHKNPWTAKCPGTVITKFNFPHLPERGTRIAWGNTIVIIK